MMKKVVTIAIVFASFVTQVANASEFTRLGSTSINEKWSHINFSINDKSVNKLINHLSDKSETEKLFNVNNYVNYNIKYVNDLNLYNSLDYWASPDETLKNKAGDCEDFAILKMAILKKLHVQTSLLIVRDMSTGEDHAVLTSNSGFILDNKYITLKYMNELNYKINYMINDSGVYIQTNKFFSINEILNDRK